MTRYQQVSYSMLPSKFWLNSPPPRAPNSFVTIFTPNGGMWLSTTSEYIGPTIQRQRRNARDRLDLTEGTQIYECEPILFRPSGLMDADHTITTSRCNPGRLSPTIFWWFSVVPFRSFDSSIFQSRLIENIVQRKCRNNKNQIKRRRRNINFSQAPSKLIQWMPSPLSRL